MTTKTKAAFSYEIPDKTRENMADPDGAIRKIDEAIANLRDILDNPDAKPEHVLAWLDGAKSLAGYKHIIRAISQFVAQEGIQGLEL